MHRLIRLAASLAMLGTVAWGPARAADSRSVSDGDRSYLVYRPAELGRTKPVPLVIVLHGGFGSGAQAEHSYNWDAQADRHGFVVAYPDGIGRSWNAGGICCGRSHRDAVDDVGFLTHLIRRVSRDENVDPKRVYLTGISNGAAMAYRYACEGTFPIAAIGSVAGSFSFACPKSQAVSVMEIHGLDDRNIPIGGGKGTKGVSGVSWLPVDRTLEVFRNADDCSPPTSQQNGVVETSTARCAANRAVVLITIAGAGHQWPGSVARHGFVSWMLRLDPPSPALDATSELWTFFRSRSVTP